MRELWVELGASMRAVRLAAGVSLRRAESGSGRGRGTLSQVETGKARPTRELVEWYEEQFGGDGVLLSIYAEARGAHGRREDVAAAAVQLTPGDALRVDDAQPAQGALVRAGSAVTATWTLTNAGTVPWTGRRLRRVGAAAARRLLTGAPAVPLPDCAPGRSVTVGTDVRVPDLAGTYAAYWYVADEDGRRCFPADDLLAVLLVAQL